MRKTGCSGETSLILSRPYWCTYRFSACYMMPMLLATDLWANYIDARMGFAACYMMQMLFTIGVDHSDAHMRFAACFTMPPVLATDFWADHTDAHMRLPIWDAHMMPNAACHMPVGSKWETSNGKAGSQKKRADLRHAPVQRDRTCCAQAAYVWGEGSPDTEACMGNAWEPSLIAWAVMAEVQADRKLATHSLPDSCKTCMPQQGRCLHWANVLA